jgi:hypothetical protein
MTIGWRRWLLAVVTLFALSIEGACNDNEADVLGAGAIGDQEGPNTDGDVPRDRGDQPDAAAPREGADAAAGTGGM